MLTIERLLFLARSVSCRKARTPRINAVTRQCHITGDGLTCSSSSASTSDGRRGSPANTRLASPTLRPAAVTILTRVKLRSLSSEGSTMAGAKRSASIARGNGLRLETRLPEPSASAAAPWDTLNSLGVTSSWPHGWKHRSKPGIYRHTQTSQFQVLLGTELVFFAEVGCFVTIDSQRVIHVSTLSSLRSNELAVCHLFFVELANSGSARGLYTLAGEPWKILCRVVWIGSREHKRGLPVPLRKKSICVIGWCSGSAAIHKFLETR